MAASSAPSSSGHKPQRPGIDVFEESYELEPVLPHRRSSAGFESSVWDEGDEVNIDGEKDALRRSSSRRASESSQQSFLLYTPDEERDVVKKFDRRLVLLVALLYLLSFLDRSNIGNARIAGMSKDLNLNSVKYEWTLRCFYITYILFEWMTLCYTIFRPSVYIAICVFSWGMIASMQSLAFSFPMLCFFRALLGISEAAFGPGVPVFLSFFYKRDELALRTGLFISAAPLATSFASSLAWAITKGGEGSPIASWRLLFLIEGFPSVIVSVVAFHCIPDRPNEATYLTARQSKVASLRLRKEVFDDGQRIDKRGLKWREIGQTLKDPKCYLTAFMFFSCNVAFSSLPVFLPTIIEDMGHSAVKSQALSAPPYLVAFFVVVLTAYCSDKFRSRGVFICLHAFLAASGYAVVAIAGMLRARAAWRYFGVYLASSGFFSAITLLITWTINNQDSDAKKGTGIAMLNIIGQMGPLVGVHLFPETQAPYYVQGMAICAGFMTIVGLLSLLLRTMLLAKNRGVDATYTKLDEDDRGSHALNSKTKKFEYIV